MAIMRNIVTITLILLIFGCVGESKSYLFYINHLEGSDQQELSELFNLLNKSEKDGEHRYVVMKGIAQKLSIDKKPEKLNTFLSTYVERNPEDIYNGYYLYLVGQSYQQNGALEFALHYYQRVVTNHTDLIVDNESIHFKCLRELIKYTTDPYEKLTYYKQILSRFSDKLELGNNLGATYYYLAKTYESIGEWEQAMQAYNNFQHFEDTSIPGEGDAHERVSRMLKINNSSRNWTAETLDQLLANIKYAIRTKNVVLLDRYKTKIDFFTLSWQHEKSNDSTSRMATLVNSLFRNSYIVFDSEFDIESNADEAYIRTTGWRYRIKTWYLYFRRIDFPADPEVHGTWEWAGIYIGEKISTQPN